MTRFVLCAAATIALLYSTTPVQAEESTARLVPLNASCFVHVNVEQLLEAEQLETLNDLVARVDSELALVFRRHLGVNALQLKEATFALPDFETMHSDDIDPPVIGFFSFNEAYHSGAMLDAIGGPWEEVKGENSLYYLNDDGLAVLFLDDNRLLCGLEAGMEWWIDSLNAELEYEPLVNAVNHAADGATFTFALNTADMPEKMRSDIPAPLRPFTDSDAVILNVYVDDEIELFAAVDFETSSEASRAERGLRGLIDLGRSTIRQQAEEIEESLKEGDGGLEDALGSVSLLALYRHADAHLQNIRIGRDDYQLQADLIIDIPAPTLIVGSLAAIAAIGEQAEGDFENVSNQLSDFE